MDADTSKAVERYKCRSPPDKLWRVTYGDSGLCARERGCFTSKKDFLRQVRRHLNWKNRCATPFVSTTCDERHARNFAAQRKEGNVEIHAIDTAQLGRPVIRVRGLVDERPDLMPSHYNDPRSYENEYLVLDYIPEASILSADSDSDSDSVSGSLLASLSTMDVSDSRSDAGLDSRCL